MNYCIYDDKLNLHIEYSATLYDAIKYILDNDDLNKSNNMVILDSEGTIVYKHQSPTLN